MALYRLKKIQVTSDWAVRRICFTYDDDQTWSVGNSSSGKDLLEAVLDRGEYLVRVTHEKYHQVLNVSLIKA
jgi:hypothetical protein